jgi:SAM-dependent methyltransferase
VESVNFDRAAAYYDATRALPAGTMDRLTAMLAAELGGRQPCLEIGVGTGRIALPLRRRGITLAGIDISGAMLRRVAVNAGGRSPVPLVQADATRLPAAAETFGSVLAVNVLHLIPGWRLAVDEAVRVSRPGGILIASFPGEGRAPRRRRQPRDAIEAAPWAGAMREALARHGLSRPPAGAHGPDEVAGYLGRRASRRAMDPVTVRETQTLGQALDRLERQIYSWTWPYTPEQVRAVGGDIRTWAARENVVLDEGHVVESEIRWWAFELRG